MPEINENLNSRNYVEKIKKIIKDANKGRKEPNAEEIRTLFMYALKNLEPEKGATRNAALSAIRASLSNAEAILGSDSEIYKELSEHLRKAIDGNKKEENETVVLNNINLDAEVEDKGNELNFVVAEEEQAVEQKDEDLELKPIAKEENTEEPVVMMDDVNPLVEEENTEEPAVEQKDEDLELKPIAKEENTEDKSEENPELNERLVVLAGMGIEPDTDNLSFIENKKNKKYFSDAIKSEKPNEALANVDDLLLAYKYLVTDEKNTDKANEARGILDPIAKEQISALIDNASNKENEAKSILDQIDKEQINALINNTSKANEAEGGIDPIVKDQIKALIDNASLIDYSNAMSFVALCKLYNGNDDCIKLLRIIEERIKQLDEENFHNMNAETLNANYVKLEKDAKKIDPFSSEYDENKEEDKDRLNLNKIMFTDDLGNRLDIKEEEKQKEALASLAREIAAQKLAKKGSYTREELEKEIKEATKEVLWKAVPAQDKDGNFRVKASAVQIISGLKFYEVENYKKRVVQKFKNTKFAKNVTKNVDELDKKLYKRFGKNYEVGKNVAKYAGGIIVGTVKNTAIFAVAGMVPGGTAVAIAYNLGKNWKNSIKPQLKDPNNSFLKKSAVIVSGVASAGLAGLGIAGDIGNSFNVSNEVLKSAAVNISSGVRMAVVSGSAVLPNVVDAITLRSNRQIINEELRKARNGTAENIEKWKEAIAKVDVSIEKSSGIKKYISMYNKRNMVKKLKSYEKEYQLRNPAYKKELTSQVEDLNDKIGAKDVGFLTKLKLQSERRKVLKTLKEASKAKSVEELEKEAKNNRQKQLDNCKEMLSKGFGVFAGMWLAQTYGDDIRESVHDMVEKAGNLAETAGKYIENSQAENNKQEIYVENSPLQPEPEQEKDYTKIDWEKQIADNKFEPGKDFGLNNDENTRDSARVPDDVSHRAEIENKNLEAANKPSVARENMSSFEHAKAHLDILGDDRIEDTEKFAKGIAGHVGDKADLATIACKMAPYALQAELGLNLPEGANPTTYQMLNYISENNLTAEQTEALNKFIDKNFEGGRFKTENFSDWKSVAPSNEQASADNTAGNGKYGNTLQEVVNNITIEAAQKSGMIPEGEWRKVNVPDTGNKVVDALNDKYATTNDKGSGYKFEPVDNKQQEPQSQQPKTEERAILVERQTAPYEHAPVYNYAALNIPPDVWMGMSPESQDYVVKNGLIYDHRLSQGIDRIGDAYVRGDGYAGMFINPHERPGGPNQVVIIPNDMFHEQPDAMRMTSALGHQANRTMWYCHKEHDFGVVGVCPDSHHRYGGYCGGYVLHDNDKYYEVLGKVNATVHTAERIAHATEHVVRHVKNIFG